MESYPLLCMGSEVFCFPVARVSSLAAVLRKPVSNFLWLSNSRETHVSLPVEKSVVLGLEAPIMALIPVYCFLICVGPARTLILTSVHFFFFCTDFSGNLSIPCMDGTCSFGNSSLVLCQLCPKGHGRFPYNHTPAVTLLILVILVLLGNAAFYFI